MKIIYIADDGKQFENKEECEHYEYYLKRPKLKEVKMYDANDNELTDFLNIDNYEITEKVIVPTFDSVGELHMLADYTGFGSYEQITDTGVWVFNRVPCKFVKVSEI